MSSASQTEVHDVRRDADTVIRYDVSGPGEAPVIVLIHGWACSRRDFDALIPHLAPRHRVIAIDLAEHGESRSQRDTWTIEEFARDVMAVLDAEGVHGALVAGHSMGGAVAVEVARRAPEAVARVVTFDALHYLFLFPAQTVEQAEALLDPFYRDFPAAVRGMVEAGSPPGTDEALKESHFQRMVSVRQPGGVRAMEALVRWDMDQSLGEVSQPLTLFAVRDLVSPEAVARYGDRMTIVPVDLGSHHFPRESPEATAQLIIGVATSGS